MREPLAENFLQDFGPASPAFQSASSLWLEALATLDKQRDSSYEHWRNSLRVAYGTPVGDEALFVRHTYLATLANLIAYLRLTGAHSPPDESQTKAIATGTFFASQGIIDFLEPDFFSWVANPTVLSSTEIITTHLAGRLFTYRLSELSEDVFKELYQSLVDPRDRHGLGEYYSPDWLATRMCNALLSGSGEDRVLDPACGSGTFLYQAIRHKRRRLPATPQSLEKIVNSVVGVDVHPLAVTVSKVNVLLALGDLIKLRTGPLSIRVLLANSIRPTRIPALPPALPPPALSPSVSPPAVSPSTSPPALSPLGERVARDGVFISRRGSSEGVPAPLRNQFDAVLGNPPWLSFRFVEKGEYQEYLKNLIVKELGLLSGAPHLITHLELATLFFARCASLYLKPSGKIAFVLPRSVFTADQHDRFRRSCGTGGAILTGVWDLEDVSPLFNVPAAVVFGGLTGEASNRIPGEILSGRLRRRNASWEEAAQDLKIEVAEFHVVQQGRRSYLSTVRKKTSSLRSFYQPHFKEGATIVPRSFWFVQIQAGPQAARERTDSHLEKPAWPSAPVAVIVSTDPRAQAEAKPPYQGIHLEAPVEPEFLYATLLSTDLLPFGHLDLRPVVLPLVKDAQGYRLLNADAARAEGYRKLPEWLERVEAIWRKTRRGKAGKSNALSWLNYRNKLTSQNPKATGIVLYTRSATFLCAAALQLVTQTSPENARAEGALECGGLTPPWDRHGPPGAQGWRKGGGLTPPWDRHGPPTAYEWWKGGVKPPHSKARRAFPGAVSLSSDQGIVLGRFLAADATYYFGTEEPKEAAYLAAVLNSPLVDTLLKPMQARGLWGPRDIHKKVWELPIPRFDSRNESHLRLAAIAEACAAKVWEMLPGLRALFRGVRGPRTIGRARTAVRKALKPELAEIDGIVREILR